MRRTFLFHDWITRIPAVYQYVVIPVLSAVSLSLPCLLASGHAQTPITSSGLNTKVNLSTSETVPVGKVQYDITGGTREGTNLFHSFGEFSVPTNNIANFLNTGSVDLNGSLLAPNLPTSNILGRVTGGNPSSIFGTIRTTDFGNANLFLMNPAGIVFGPNASLNVGGSVTFTTANYLRLAEAGGTNAGIFHADQAMMNSVLTSAPVAAFGFLGSNPAAISVQGSTLAVQPGQSISLVGGHQGFSYSNPDTGVMASVSNGMTVIGGKLSAPRGQVNLAGTASPGEFLAGTWEHAANTSGESFGSLGAIEVTQKSAIDVSGAGGGTVRIRGGRFVLNDSTIFANITGPEVAAPGGGIDIDVAQDAVIQNGAVLQTNVSGNATPGVQYGGVTLKADRIEILGSQDFQRRPSTGIASEVALRSTGGSSGDINLEADSILIKDFGTFSTRITTRTRGVGNSGDITLKTTGNLEIDGVVFITTNSSSSPSGNAGSIELISTQGSISMTNAPFVSSQALASSTGTVGSITVSAPAGDILLADGVLFTRIDGTGANAGKGGIQLTAQNLTIENAGIQIDNFTPFQPGDMTVNLTGRLSLSGTLFPSTLLTTTRRSARSADLNITAHDVLLTDGSLVATETFRDGDAGTLNFFTQNLEITNGAQIRSSSRFNPFPPPGQPPEIPSGAGGTITIQGLASPAESILIDGPGSGIFTNTEGSGAGGSISLFANSVTVQNGGKVSAATSGSATSATGGTITVEGSQVQLDTGAVVTAETSGPADAGNILIKADTFSMTGGATVTANSTGSGAAGTVTIEGTASPAQSIVIDGTGSGIFTTTSGTGAGGDMDLFADTVTLQNGGTLSATSTGTAATAVGGTIGITATESVSLTGGASIAASSSGPADAGNIAIDAGNSFFMQDSSVTTSATQASGGDISVQASSIFRMINSQMTASVQQGSNTFGGNITIDPQFVILQNQSQILATAVEGTGGNILIVTPVFLADQTSLVDASSQFGRSGTVTIQSPTSQLAGTLATLPQSVRQAAALNTVRCAAQMGGQASSFIVAGRDTLPAEPGGWMMSALTLTPPLSLAGRGETVESAGAGREARGDTLTPSLSQGEREQTVSLRRMTPGGFLTQAFAIEGSPGCGS
ncbi:MAG: filamentous hemagglutinin N-terminal domain-containing protein [Nitrospirota bacterium]